ncbi:MAG: hypothetical protein FWD94_04560 [Treponema sp.]|nr:hypothetical protein [Treponema sp.]
MKKSFRTMPAVLTALALTLAGGCIGGNGYPPEMYLSVIAKQVYEKVKDDATGEITYQKFEEARNIEVSPEGIGSASLSATGRLTFDFGPPKTPIDAGAFADTMFADNYTDVSVSDDTAKATAFVLGVGADHHIYRGRNSYTADLETATVKNELVVYVYADRPVVMSGKGEKGTPDANNVTLNTTDFSLSLGAGWNAVYMASDGNGPADGSSLTLTKTVSLDDNKDLMWIYGPKE